MSSFPFTTEVDNKIGPYCYGRGYTLKASKLPGGWGITNFIIKVYVPTFAAVYHGACAYTQ